MLSHKFTQGKLNLKPPKSPTHIATKEDLKIFLTGSKAVWPS